MKKIFYIFISLFLFFGSSAQALTLLCDVPSQSDQGNFTGGHIRQSTIDNFSPRKQVHAFNFKERTATYLGPDFKTKLDVLNDRRIAWKYVHTFANEKKTVTHTIGFKYIYLRKKHKLVATVDFGPAYMKIVSVGARCKEYK